MCRRRRRVSRLELIYALVVTGLLLGSSVLALWITAGMGTIPVLAAAAVWLAASYPLLLTPPSREGPRPAEAAAEVRGVTLVDKSPVRVSRTRHSRPKGSTGDSKSRTRWSSWAYRWGSDATR